jgi:hypothetical protein
MQQIGVITRYAVWQHIEGGAAMAYRRDKHWIWQPRSVMTTVQGRKQSVRIWLYNVFGGFAEFHFTTTPPQTVMGPKCGVGACVNPYHAREMTRRELYEVTVLPKDISTADMREQHILMSWEQDGVPADITARLLHSFDYSEMPRAPFRHEQYEDVDGVDMYAAGNRAASSVFFRYAVEWDKQPKVFQVAAAELAKGQMVARAEHWGRQALYQAEYFTEYMLKWIERTAPGLLGDFMFGLGPDEPIIDSWQLAEALLGNDDKSVRKQRKRARKARAAGE